MFPTTGILEGIVKGEKAANNDRNHKNDENDGNDEKDKNGMLEEVLKSVSTVLPSIEAGLKEEIDSHIEKGENGGNNILDRGIVFSIFFYFSYFFLCFPPSQSSIMPFVFSMVTFVPLSLSQW